MLRKWGNVAVDLINVTFDMNIERQWLMTLCRKCDQFWSTVTGRTASLARKNCLSRRSLTESCSMYQRHMSPRCRMMEHAETSPRSDSPQ